MRKSRARLAFALSKIGCEAYGAGTTIARHRHRDAYAALVLTGSYEEAGNEGRWTVAPGDVLIHGAFDSHADRFGGRGAQILNLPLPDLPSVEWHAGRVSDADEIAHAAERNPKDAVRLLVERAQPRPVTAADWPDILRAWLNGVSPLTLAKCARELGVSGETLSRGFGRLYGVTPARFRAEARARRAWKRIVCETAPLARIAVEESFADQSHMTRAVVALTGIPPAAWRRTTARTSNPFKTAARLHP